MPFDPSAIERHHVPGDGPIPSRIMLIGEAPGQTENSTRIPFSGQSGIELRRYLRSAGLFRNQCYATNICKFWPPQLPTGKQLPPSSADIARDEPELLQEIEFVRPEIIVAIGGIATRYFLGSKLGLHVTHGIPHQIVFGGRQITVMPAVHPAAGLHSSGEQVRIQWDFEQLGKLVYGRIPDHPEIDAHPSPSYERVTDADIVSFRDWLAGATELGIDTEGSIADPWCVTVSRREGEAKLIRATERECLAALNAHLNAPHGKLTVEMHYAAHDIPVLGAMDITLPHADRNRDGSLRLRDTMSELYLLGTEPKGLKAAEYRLAGMLADSYEDVTYEAEARVARAYLQSLFDSSVCRVCYGVGKLPKRGKKGQELKSTVKCDRCVDGLMLPATPEEHEIGADGVMRTKRPWSVSRRLKKILDSDDFTPPEDDDENEDEQDDADIESDAPAGYAALRKRWMRVPAEQRREVAEQYGHMPKTTLSDVADQERVTYYACRDACATGRIAHKLEPRIHELSLARVRQIDAEIIPMLSRMEVTGMLIDRGHFERLSIELGLELDRLRAELSALVGSEGTINPNSPKIGDLLFREFGLPVIKLTKSKSREAIDDEVLGALQARLKGQIAEAERNGLSADPISVIALQIIAIVLEYREKQKLKTTYADPLLDKQAADGRIHTTLKYTHVATGRLSSAQPNLQNLVNPDNSPIWGRRIREGFVAAPGMKILSCDYSQIEMVLGACIANEPNMLRAFREGLDLHKLAASMMFDVPYDEVPKPLRTQTKPINFGAFYGMMGMRLQMQYASMGIEKSVEECDALITKYFEKFPRILEWKRELWSSGRELGYVETMFGRKRWTPGLRSDIPKVRAAAEREAANHPIQGSAQDIIRLGMREVWQVTLPMMWAERIPIEPLNQIHDELLFEVAAEYAEIAGILVSNAMRNVVSLQVPINVGVAIGDNWAAAK